MFPLWSIFLFAFLAVLGATLLIKSIGKLIAVYNTGTRIEWSAQLPEFDFALKDPGAYEIAVKRPSSTGIIPTGIPFQLSDLSGGKTVPVRAFVNLLSQRKDMSGNRIVPIAEFAIEQPGNYRITHPAMERFKANDKLIVMPKTGSKGFLMIFAVLFSAFLFIGGLVLFLLSVIKK
ncbi:hypothetical protein GCM10028803_36770 [Larkinella knui]|uniref:Uncharacterized protein n=1 Tax=Larkinella knui TaxID=2025310 RepID=A0A3P1CDV8_9BACT|nr:hypothetical protein [Larkinella knui]RRB11533.1 hypothetical protein EHT87_23970 [Larkinella knui]